MNYSFKLSRRIARFRVAPALALVLLTLSCSDDPSGLGPNASPGPAQVLISPDSVSVGADQAVQFTAATATSDNLSFSRGGGGHGGPKSRVVSVAVAPQRTTLEAGTTSRFSATATLSNGTTTIPTLRWTATGGMIDDTGLYTAGSTAGQFAVIATAGNGVADTATVTVATLVPVPARIVLSPTSDTLAAGATAQFAAVGKTSDGTTVGVAPAFTATGGTVTSAGLYTAGRAAGKYRVIATDPSTGLADTAAVMVSPPPNTLQSLSVTPAAVTLASGRSQQFAATGTMSDGSTSNMSARWTSTGGTISAAGVYTAGQTAGTYRVIAVDSATGRADSAAVTITAATTTLQAVVLTPASVSLTSGATQQYTASGRMSDGSTSAVVVTWSTSGGTISSAGLYTAGQTAGTYRVIAAVGAGFADTSSVAITLPSSSVGISIAPGESWQAKVDANPPGTAFRILAGTHQNQTVVPKTGDSFTGDPGAIMDGGLVNTYAIRTCSGCTGSSIASNVTISNLEIRRYKPAFQDGAIQGGGGSSSQSSHGWVIKNCNIHDNVNGAGIRLGAKMQVLNNNVHHNGEIGLVGYADSALIQGNELAYNNTQNYSMGNESGGFKIVQSHGTLITGNYSHHNHGPGMWTDGDNVDVIYENNRVEDNDGMGIFHEISWHVIIRNNTVKRNGFGMTYWYYGAGILISASADAEIYGNTVEDNARGIIGIMQNRGAGALGTYDLHNLYAHDNVVVMTPVASDGSSHNDVTGVAQDVQNQAYFTSKGNRFVHNSYSLGTAPRYFTWGDRELTESEWKAAGQDLTATFTR